MAKEIGISKIYGPAGDDIEAALKKGIKIHDEENVRKELRRGAENAKTKNFDTPARVAGSDDEQEPQVPHLMGGPPRKRRV